MTLKEEIQLKNYIKGIIKENFFNDFGVAEKSKSKRGNHSDATKNKMPGKRAHVISMLKNPGLDNAPYAYKLWPRKDKANARSQFYKCRDGEKNDNGDVYSFTDREIVRLYSMLSDPDVLTIK